MSGLITGPTPAIGSSDRKPMTVAVVGTRGVPARYGGFETLAEQLARNIDAGAVELAIYGESTAYDRDERGGRFLGHRRVWMPLSAGGAQSILHDALQLFHAAFIARSSRILLLGTSGAWLLPLVRLLRPRLRIVTNIDGLEWRRDKFGHLARSVLRVLEKVAVRWSNAIIADNDALVPMVQALYQTKPVMISYGADQVELIDGKGADPKGYLLAIARVEPENNAAMILEAAMIAGAPIVFVGNWSASDYGRMLHKRFAECSGFDLRPPIYEQSVLSGIRSGSSVYVHGHSVGGTNPSLVEAIFHADRILAFDCPFNRATLRGNGAYFRDTQELAGLIQTPDSGRISVDEQIALRTRYRWAAIVRQYLEILQT